MPAGLKLPCIKTYITAEGIIFARIAHKSKLNIGHSEYMYNEVVNEAKILSGGDISFFKTKSLIAQRLQIIMQSQRRLTGVFCFMTY